MELQVYKNAEFGSVRTTTIGGQPYFVGKDVAGILGYANTRKALIDHIDEEDKDDVTIRDAIGRNQTMTAINESGLYSLILSSKMPNAKKFKRWVTNEVLPAIRKHRLYVTDDLIANPDLAIAAFTALKEEREKNKELMAAVAIGQQQIAEMKPIATYYDVVLKCRDAVNISVIAKDYGWSAIRMNEYLHEKGIQSNRVIFGCYIKSMLQMAIQKPILTFMKIAKVSNIRKCILSGHKKEGSLSMNS
ncbi:hypothetical protein ERTO105960_07020 [Erysipelothrix tonsillarum]